MQLLLSLEQDMRVEETLLQILACQTLHHVPIVLTFSVLHNFQQSMLCITRKHLVEQHFINTYEITAWTPVRQSKNTSRRLVYLQIRKGNKVSFRI